MLTNLEAALIGNATVFFLETFVLWQIFARIKPSIWRVVKFFVLRCAKRNFDNKLFFLKQFKVVLLTFTWRKGLKRRQIKSDYKFFKVCIVKNAYELFDISTCSYSAMINFHRLLNYRGILRNWYSCCFSVKTWKVLKNWDNTAILQPFSLRVAIFQLRTFILFWYTSITEINKIKNIIERATYFLRLSCKGPDLIFTWQERDVHFYRFKSECKMLKDDL